MFFYFSKSPNKFWLQVRIDHMALALSKTYRSPVVDTIQSLPQHQQVILLSIMCYLADSYCSLPLPKP